ncbi:MAG TPA: iron-sulfur cluster assembly protein, partial [Cyclobacteriaceae bacterium]|nr:iron-sulfur cluster assembly protein [Cyclobacteriaceae bacterium]
METLAVTRDDVYAWLDEVKDPEIPVLSLVDLGVITNVVMDGLSVKVEMTPTFVGCPAMDVMKNEVLDVLRKHGVADPTVEINFKQPWTSDMISEKGKAALRKFGLAPPPNASQVFSDLSILEHAV